MPQALLTCKITKKIDQHINVVVKPRFGSNKCLERYLNRPKFTNRVVHQFRKLYQVEILFPG